MTGKEPVGLTALYKDGECKVVDGDDVAKLQLEGWKDSPPRLKTKPQAA